MRSELVVWLGVEVVGRDMPVTLLQKAFVFWHLGGQN